MKKLIDFFHGPVKKMEKASELYKERYAQNILRQRVMVMQQKPGKQ